MTNPLAFTPFEVALVVSTLIGVLVAVFLLREAARSRLGWSPAITTAVLAVAVPVVGPAVALFVCWNLRGAGRRTPQPTDLAPSI